MHTISYAQIEPVGQCNLRCRMCAIQFRQDGPPHGPLAFMEFDTFCRLLAQMPALKHLHLQGLGEPTMHPRFFDMVGHAAARGVRVSTNTNLTLFTERRARLCVESGLQEMHVSLDGASAETFERIRVGARFERVLRNLERIVRLRGTNQLPRVRLIMVIMRDNLHELPALVRLAGEFGIDELFVQHLCHDFGESTLPSTYLAMRDFVQSQTLLHEDLQRIEDCFSRARATAERVGVSLRLPRARPRPHAAEVASRSRCDWPWRGPYISYRGEAMPCCMVSTPDRINFGNMAEQGVQPLWQGQAYASFRAALASDEPPEVCRSCAVYHGVF